MTTTRETLTTLMTLVDKHSDDLKEGEYIMVCNLLRDIHRGANVQQPTGVTDFAAQSEGWRIQRRLESARREEYIHTHTSPRVKISDKMYIFGAHYPDIVGWAEAYHCGQCDTEKIRHMECSVLMQYGVVVHSYLTRLYQSRRDQRHETERTAVLARITTLTERLSQLTPHPTL